MEGYIIINEKICTKCRTIKPITEFWQNSDGNWRSWCKECKYEYDRGWNKTIKGKAKRKRYSLKHRDKINVANQRSHQKHKEHDREYQQMYGKTPKGKLVRKRIRFKRKGLGFEPLNGESENTVAHHIDDVHIIYIPKNLHENCAYPNRAIHRKLVVEKLKEYGFDDLLNLIKEHIK